MINILKFVGGIASGLLATGIGVYVQSELNLSKGETVAFSPNIKSYIKKDFANGNEIIMKLVNTNPIRPMRFHKMELYNEKLKVNSLYDIFKKHLKSTPPNEYPDKAITGIMSLCVFEYKYDYSDMTENNGKLFPYRLYPADTYTFFKAHNSSWNPDNVEIIKNTLNNNNITAHIEYSYDDLYFNNFRRFIGLNSRTNTVEIKLEIK